MVKMVHFYINFASFFTPWAACLFIIILNAPKVESDIDPTTMVHDHGPPTDLCPSILPVVDPVGDPVVKPPPPSVLPVVDPIIDPVDPMPIIITPPDMEKIYIFYKKESEDGGLGIKMYYEFIQGWNEMDKLNITVSYDTESSTAATFFAEQFTIELFRGLNGCDVFEWNLAPCKKCKMEGGRLSCPKEEQCERDKIHACVASLYASDMPKVATFVICYFTQNKNAQECACNNDLNYDDIWKCANAEEGARTCDFFHRSIHSEENEEVDPSYTNLDAIADFKGTACFLLKEAKLTCDFCSC